MKILSKYGLGLRNIYWKNFLEKNFANIILIIQKTGGAEVLIKWKNKDLKN